MALGRSASMTEDAGAAGGMLGEAAGAIFGLEDKEAAVERILQGADWETEAGRDALLAAVGKIDPDAYAELQKQMNETALSDATTKNALMNSENQLIAHKQKIFGAIYTKDFERDASNQGEGFAIHYFLQKNDIDFDPKKVKTIAQAEALIKKHMGKKSNYKATQKQLNTYVEQQRNMYILMRATLDAGVEIKGGTNTTAAVNKFDAPVEDTSTETQTETQTIPTDFNPLTTPEGPDFKAEKDGQMGTWSFYNDWIGGQGGHEIKEWRFTPDMGSEYTNEDAIVYAGATAKDMEQYYNNFL